MTDHEMPNQQSSPPLTEILRKVSADIEQGRPIEQPVNEVALGDPAPDPLAVHHERLAAIISNTSALAMDQGRQARDGIDRVLRTFANRDEELTAIVEKHVSEYREAMNHFRIIAEALANVDRMLNAHTVVVEAPPAGKPHKNNGNGKRG